MHTPTRDCKWVLAGDYRKNRRVWMVDDTGLDPVTSGLRVSGSAGWCRANGTTEGSGVRARACVPTRCRSRSSASAPSRSCRTSRASRARRTASGAPRRECAVVRGHGTRGESECRTEKLAALVEHGLLDDLVRPYQHRLRNCHAQSFGGFQVDPEGKAPGLLHRQISWLRPFEDLVD